MAKRHEDGALYGNGCRLMSRPIRCASAVSMGFKVADCESAEHAAELADCYNQVHGLGDGGKRWKRLRDVLLGLIQLHGRKEVRKMMKVLR